MTLYKGSQQIRDIGNFGVFYGNNPIRQIFKGSELVYQYHPFEPQSIIINKSESITVEHSLPQGRYYVEVVGAGGSGKYRQGGYFAMVYAGGSGARFSAEISVKGDNHTISMVCGAGGQRADGGNSSFSIDGVTVATGGGGKRGWPDSSPTQIGYGGTVSSNTNIPNVVFSSVTSLNGNTGQHSDNAGTSKKYGGASVASTGTYGKGADASSSTAGSGVAGNNGWIFLKYLGAI